MLFQNSKNNEPIELLNIWSTLCEERMVHLLPIQITCELIQSENSAKYVGAPKLTYRCLAVHTFLIGRLISDLL